MDQHFLQSSFREKLIEHLLIGALLKQSWQDGSCSLEIARPEVDNHGYDIVAEDRGCVRHIQLKASRVGGHANGQNIHTSLAEKPSGCVVWVVFDEQTLELGPFRLLGGSPGEPLPDVSAFRTAKHTKADSHGVKAERPAIRRIPRGKFTDVATIGELYRMLFGE